MTEPARHCPDDSTRLKLALGELTGRDRADALAHVAACPTCREQVQALVETTEQLVLTAPDAEPPAGFESAVIARLTAAAPRRRPRRWQVMAAAAIAVVVVAAAVGIGVRVAGQGHSELAETAMFTPDGRDVGRAWRYEAHPTWVLVSVPRWRVWELSGDGPHEYRLHAELDDGTHRDLGALEFATRSGAWGTTTTVDANRIRTVTVTDTKGHIWCRGEF